MGTGDLDKLDKIILLIRIGLFNSSGSLIALTIGPRREKTCFRRFANNKDADQPEYARSLISAFVIRLLESMISRLARSEISIL